MCFFVCTKKRNKSVAADEAEMKSSVGRIWSAVGLEIPDFRPSSSPRNKASAKAGATLDLW